MSFDSLAASLVLNSRGFSRGAAQAQDDMSALEARAQSVGGAMKHAGAQMSMFVTLPLAAAGAAAVKTASDVHELQNRMQVTFGDSTKEVVAWSKTVARATNRSRYQLQKFVTTLGTTFTALGFGADQTEQMSKKLAKLAVDLSSFYNLSTSDALDRLRSGLVGNYEALDKFGVSVTAAQVKQVAYQQGIAETGSQLTEQQKVLARMQLVLQATSDAQGDAARTSGSFANELKGLKAQAQAVGASYGELLIPAAKSLVTTLKGMAKWMDGLSANQKKIVIGAAALAAALGPVLFVGGALLAMLPSMAAGWEMVAGAEGAVAALNLSTVVPSFLAVDAAAAPVLLTLGALGAAAALLYAAWDSNFLGIQNRAKKAGGLVNLALDTVIAGIQAVFWPLTLLYNLWKANFLGIHDITDEVVTSVTQGIDWVIKQIDKLPDALKHAVNSIPGVSWSDLFPPKPAAEEGKKAGTEAATAAADAYQKHGGVPTSSAFPTPTSSHAAGVAAGKSFANGVQQGVDKGQTIKTSGLTPALRSFLHQHGGQYGFKTKNLQDKPMAITEKLFKGMAEHGGVSASKLGISANEFNTLANRYYGNGGMGSSSAAASTFANGGPSASTTSGASSSGPSVQELVDALRQALDGLGVRLSVDDEVLRQVIDQEAEVTVEDVLAREKQKQKRRGLRG